MKLLINGEWRDAASGAVFDSDDPFTGATWARIPRCAADDVDAAVAAARVALDSGPWASMHPSQRGQCLRRLGDLIARDADGLALAEVRDNGKLWAEMRGQCGYIPQWFHYFGGLADKIEGAVLPIDKPDMFTYTRHEPVGVVAAITPWNFPIAMITRKVAPALAAGCPVVIKPAEQTPLSALACAELAQRAGLPAGVLNIVTGDADSSIEIGGVLCASDTVRHLSFTGSTEVGRILMKQCAPTIKKMSLELGGNAPFIVFDDADIDSAVEGAMISKYRNAGQTCVCANRLYVQDKVYDPFVEKLAAKVAAIRVGNGFEAGINQGPLIDEGAFAKVESHVADALAKGARLVTGGQRIGERFYTPTVLADVTADMLCATEETFGPVAPIFRFSTEAEVVAAANATEFGLASYFYIRDIGRIFRVGEALEYGMVGINTGLISVAEVPFGGVKQSGLGREGSHHGIDDYVEVKYLCISDILR